MSHLRTRRLSLYGAVVVAFVIGGATGCTASTDVGKATSTAQSAAATPESTAVDDERTCAALGDVRTILFNARAAFIDGRMGQDELNHWAALASRVLSNAPGADDGTIADALEAVKEAAPDGQSLLGGFAPEGNDPTAELAAACEAAGYTVVMSGFVGG